MGKIYKIVPHLPNHGNEEKRPCQQELKQQPTFEQWKKPSSKLPADNPNESKSQAQASQVERQQVKVTFKNAEGVKVKETISTFHDGDAKELLIDLEKELIRLGNCYDLFKDRKWKPFMQLRGQALGGRIERYWSKIVEGATITQTRTVASHLSKFKKLIQKANTKYLGRGAADIQHDAMLMGELRYEGEDHKKAIEPLFEINNDIELFSEEVEGFAICEMVRKIIPQMPKLQARLIYVDKGGKQLH